MHTFFLLLTTIVVCLNGNVISNKHIRSAIRETRDIKACDKWYNAEPHPLVFLEQIRDCPCNIPPSFPKEHHDGSKIWKTDTGCAASSQPNTCKYHQGAHGCYRFAYKSKGPGAQCCYNKAGVWISDPFEGAGTLDRETAPENILNLIQWNAHNNHDVKPYDYCCTDADTTRETCKKYFEKRPPGKCVNY